MEAAAGFDGPTDGWLIARLRARPQRRLDDLLLERRLRHLDVGGLIDHLARLEDEVVELRAKLTSADAQHAPGHVLFLPTPDGYVIVEADEAPPPVGQLLMLENRWFRVHRVGRSPLPRDRRPCLFLEIE
jgi:hypothetical protein